MVELSPCDPGRACGGGPVAAAATERLVQQIAFDVVERQPRIDQRRDGDR